jgi:hypothetical protein
MRNREIELPVLKSRKNSVFCSGGFMVLQLERLKLKN